VRERAAYATVGGGSSACYLADHQRRPATGRGPGIPLGSHLVTPRRGSPHHDIYVGARKSFTTRGSRTVCAEGRWKTFLSLISRAAAHLGEIGRAVGCLTNEIINHLRDSIEVVAQRLDALS
jgi:hypothetical protein